MKNVINLVNKSFVSSDELNNKMAKVNALKIQFISSLNDEQCVEFLKFCVEIEELQKIQIKEYINHTYKVCKDVFSLR